MSRTAHNDIHVHISVLNVICVLPAVDIGGHKHCMPWHVTAFNSLHLECFFFGPMQEIKQTRWIIDEEFEITLKSEVV